MELSIISDKRKLQDSVLAKWFAGVCVCVCVCVCGWVLMWVLSASHLLLS